MPTDELELLRQENVNLKRQIELLKQHKVVEVSGDSYQTIDNPMSRAIFYVLKKVMSADDTNALTRLYTKMWSFANYALICGLGGTLVNYFILSSLVPILPLIIADVCAILIAAFWNYTLTVGYLGYLSGLAPKKKKGDWLD
jgi:VIT1/CCC1 family predicted Fe2+/Mn2+ transporter